MQVHNLNPINKPKRKKRIGRGGKRGTFCGRGSKGQRSRAGGKIRPQLREIINKFPKRRGEGLKTISAEIKEVQLKDIQKYFPEGGVISPQILVKNGIIHRKPKKKLIVKILGTGDLTVKYHIQNCILSKQAREAIIKSGGQIT
ncbi:MAG: 50S ribosomal protein L15 [Parcubacteria group bacterium]|nr:50S ribosomal protein L15 [Parcubacteria group bacterium]